MRSRSPPSYDYLKVWVLQDDFYPPVAGAEPPAGEEIPLDPPEAGDLSATANVNLNVRAGPGMLFKVIGHVLKGQTGEILGSSPDGFWYAFSIPPEGLQAGRMSYDTGWVSANFATLDNPSGDPLPIVIPPLLPQLVYVDQPAPGAPQLTTQQPATVRTGPKLTFPILGVTSVGAIGRGAGQERGRRMVADQASHLVHERWLWLGEQGLCPHAECLERQGDQGQQPSVRSTRCPAFGFGRWKPGRPGA